MKTKKCINCGKDNYAKKKNCTECGGVLEDTVTEIKQKYTEKIGFRVLAGESLELYRKYMPVFAGFSCAAVIAGAVNFILIEPMNAEGMFYADAAAAVFLLWGYAALIFLAYEKISGGNTPGIKLYFRGIKKILPAAAASLFVLMLSIAGSVLIFPALYMAAAFMPSVIASVLETDGKGPVKTGIKLVRGYVKGLFVYWFVFFAVPAAIVLYVTIMHFDKGLIIYIKYIFLVLYAPFFFIFSVKIYERLKTIKKEELSNRLILKKLSRMPYFTGCFFMAVFFTGLFAGNAFVLGIIDAEKNEYKKPQSAAVFDRDRGMAVKFYPPAKNRGIRQTAKPERTYTVYTGEKNSIVKKIEITAKSYDEAGFPYERFKSNHRLVERILRKERPGYVEIPLVLKKIYEKSVFYKKNEQLINRKYSISNHIIESGGGYLLFENTKEKNAGKQHYYKILPEYLLVLTFEYKNADPDVLAAEQRVINDMWYSGLKSAGVFY
ncbi:MAG TPA: hypothetical protein ENN55_01260 [Firmicutes bacterium]|nr:hypothetical protein [Bacillota bacterium]